MDSIILKKEYRRTIHETDGAFLESDHDGAYTIHSWALDPTEDDLIKASNTFSQEYSALLSKKQDDKRRCDAPAGVLEGDHQIP